MDILPLGQRELVLRGLGVVLGHDDGVGHHLPVDITEVVPAEPDADGRGRVAQLGREHVSVGHRRGPDGHVLLPAHLLPESDPGLGLNLEGVVLAREQVLDGALALGGIELAAVDRDERLALVGRQAELDDEPGDDAVGLQARNLPPEVGE